MASLQQPLSMEASPSPLSSRAQSRDLQFSRPLLEMFFRPSEPGLFVFLRGTSEGLERLHSSLPGPHIMALGECRAAGNPGNLASAFGIFFSAEENSTSRSLCGQVTPDCTRYTSRCSLDLAFQRRAQVSALHFAESTKRQSNDELETMRLMSVGYASYQERRT
jgi:hypothetical protein